MKKERFWIFLLFAVMVMFSACPLENQADGETIETEKLPRVLAPIEFGVAPETVSAKVIPGAAAILNLDMGGLKRHINRLDIRPLHEGRNIRWELWAAPFPLGDSPDTQEGAIKVAAGMWNYAAGDPRYIDFLESNESLIVWRFDARYLQFRQILPGVINAAFQENGSSITLDVYGHFSGEAVDKARLGEACAKGIDVLQSISIHKPVYKPLYAELHGEYDEQGLLIRYGALREMSAPEDASLPLNLKLARQMDIDNRTETLCDVIQSTLLVKK